MNWIGRRQSREGTQWGKIEVVVEELTKKKLKINEK